MFDVIPPTALLILNVSILVSLSKQLGVIPRKRLALVCAIAPAVYGLGALLYLLLDSWRPGVAFGAVGTLLVPAAVAISLVRTRALQVGVLVMAALTWVLVWVPIYDQFLERPQIIRASELTYAAYTFATILVSLYGLRTTYLAGEGGGLERRILVLTLPFFLLGLIYLLLKGPGTTRPVFSTSVHVGAEIVLLMLVSQQVKVEEETPSTIPGLVLQGLLLAVGALLLLVFAGNLGAFPQEALPLVVASLVATGLALVYGVMRPTLDLILKNALYPEAHAAEQRLKSLQTELDAAQDRLREAEHLSLVGQLAAQVAHEIKNPLGPIKGYTKIIERETLKAGALTEKVQRGIEIIREEVEAIDARARGLLELARPPQPHMEDVDFVEIGQDVIDLVASDCPAAIKIVWSERPGEAPGRGDRVLLKSALTNVVQNAIQVLEANAGGTIQLSLVRDEAPAAWELRVDDDGPGLPGDDPEALFRPFVSHREGGSGLGLVISRGSMRAMGGDLDLSNREDGGARAVFRLPSDGTITENPESTPTEEEPQ